MPILSKQAFPSGPAPISCRAGTPAPRRNPFPWRRFFLALAILLPHLPAAAAATVLPRWKIRIIAPDSTANGLRDIVERTGTILHDWYGPPPGKLPWLRLEIAANSKPSKASPRRLLLPEGSPLLQACHAIALAMLHRRARALRRPEDPPAQSLDAFARAVTFELLYARNHPGGLRRLPDYTPAYFRLAGGPGPELAVLLGVPLSPDFPLFYTLSAMECHLFFRAVSSGSARAATLPRRLFLAVARGRRPLQAARTLCAARIPPGQTFQIWIRRKMKRLAWIAACRMPASLLMAHVRRLQTVTILSPNGPSGDFGHTRVPLEDLAAQLADYSLSSDVVRELIEEFQALQPHAPAPFQPALIEYIDTLERMARGRKWGIRRRLRRAGRRFAAAARRQKRIDAWLDQIAVQTLPPEVRLAPLYEALHFPPALRCPSVARIDAYLDQVEKQLAQIHPASNTP